MPADQISPTHACKRSIGDEIQTSTSAMFGMGVAGVMAALTQT